MPNSLHLPVKNEAYRFHPSQLTGEARAKHVIKSLLAYNKGIIENNPEGADLKFQKLLTSAFVFMRGTADLMYRDLYKTDGDKSMVLCMGDVHLENYGVMEKNDGSLLWGLNDFDEANFAPFTWDVKRGATSVILAARDSSRKERFSKKESKKMAKAFAAAYLQTVEERNEKKDFHNTLPKDDQPELLRDLLKKASEVNGEKWLRKKYLDPKSSTPRFKNTDEVVRVNMEGNDLEKQIQASIDEYLQTLKNLGKEVPDEIKVWDLATKTGSGTGSIGLWRYYALVETTEKEASQLLILELKQERKSVLDPYVDGGVLKFHSEGSRVAYAEHIQLPNANPFYGYTDFGKISYLVRERSPYKMRVDLADLTSYKDFKSYVEACGKTLALAHLQSDSVLRNVYPDFPEAILHSVNPDTFASDMSGFASKMARQIRRDWKYFKRSHAEGTFEFE